jgi:hypothetical protein
MGSSAFSLTIRAAAQEIKRNPKIDSYHATDITQLLGTATLPAKYSPNSLDERTACSLAELYVALYDVKVVEPERPSDSYALLFSSKYS